MMKKNNHLSGCIFIAIFFSSIVGAQFLGVSLNKVCIIPLFFHLIIHINKPLSISQEMRSLIAFYFFASVSAILSLFATYSNIEGYNERSIFFSIQMIIIYIPLAVLLHSYSNKDAIMENGVKALLITFRINIVVVIVEFISFFIVDVKLTNIILEFFYGEKNLAALINIGALGIFLRPTGLNMDPAYLGIILVFGFIFEKNTKWRIGAIVAAGLSMSRTAVVVILLIYIYRFVKSKKYNKIKVRTLIITISLISGVLILYMDSAELRSQISAMLERFKFVSEVSSADVGTVRHLLYIPKSIEIFLTNYNPIQMLLGFGPRQSGTILANSNVMNEYLNQSMFKYPWTTECDFSELLLGYGVVGFILYYYNVFKLGRRGKLLREVTLSLFVYSFFYDVSASTLVTIIILIFIACGSNTKHIENVVGEKEKE